MATTSGVATSFITFTRASTATRVNASGLIESVASGASRIDYDPVTLASKGLLVEEQRTNLLLQSGFASGWAGTRASITTGAAISPDGTANAVKIVEDTTAANTHMIAQSVALTANTTYTFSVYAKAAERSSIQLRAVYTDNIAVSFDLSSGTYVTVSGSPAAASMTAMGNGWYRCSITGSQPNTATYGFQIRMQTSSQTYNGDGTSGLYVYGAQLEVGTFPTSYIPTTSASVTRSADAASIATSAFPYNSSAGTIIVEATTPNANSVNPGGGVPALVAFTDGTTNNRIQLTRSAVGNNMIYGVFSSASSQASLTTTTSWANDTTNKIAVAWASNDFAVAFKSDAVLTDTSGLLPVGISKLNIGSRDGTSYWCGWIQNITYIPRRLTNTELQGRTL